MDVRAKSYVENGGYACPFCDSADIVSGGLDADGHVALAEVECNGCGKTWKDVFTLTGVKL